MQQISLRVDKSETNSRGCDSEQVHFAFTNAGPTSRPKRGHRMCDDDFFPLAARNLVVAVYFVPVGPQPFYVPAKLWPRKMIDFRTLFLAARKLAFRINA